MFFPTAMSPLSMSYFIKWDATGCKQGLISRAAPEDNSGNGPWCAGAIDRGTGRRGKRKQTNKRKLINKNGNR